LLIDLTFLNVYSPDQAKQSLVYSYTYAFTGFAAVLSKEQATTLMGNFLSIKAVANKFPGIAITSHIPQFHLASLVR